MRNARRAGSRHQHDGKFAPDPGVIEPHLLALGRWSVAALLMLPFAWREIAERAPQWRAELPTMFLLGALGMWVCGAFVYIGGRTTSAVNISLLYSLAPVLIAILSAYLFNDRLRGWQIVGVMLALTGMVIIVVKGSWQSLIAVQFVVGDLWVITAMLCWTAYSVLLRRQPSVLGPFARLTIISAAHRLADGCFSGADRRLATRLRCLSGVFVHATRAGCSPHRTRVISGATLCRCGGLDHARRARLLVSRGRRGADSARHVPGHPRPGSGRCPGPRHHRACPAHSCPPTIAMTTRILVSHTDAGAQKRWERALRAALPATFDIVDTPDPEVRHLVTWTPADDLFNALPALQTCFSAAAGVDHLIDNPSLPPALPVYRLLDAGMAATRSSAA